MDRTSRWYVGLFLAGLLVLGASWLWTRNLSPVEPSPAQLNLGAQVYQDHCASCHGAKAVGQNPALPKGGLDPEGRFIAPALNGSGHAWHHSPAVLRQIVTLGSPAQGSAMAGFKGRLSDEEIRAVIAYFQSLWPQEIQDRYRMQGH